MSRSLNMRQLKISLHSCPYLQSNAINLWSNWNIRNKVVFDWLDITRPSSFSRNKFKWTSWIIYRTLVNMWFLLKKKRCNSWKSTEFCNQPSTGAQKFPVSEYISRESEAPSSERGEQPVEELGVGQEQASMPVATEKASLAKPDWWWDNSGKDEQCYFY